LKLSVMPDDRNGPKLLMALITKIYRPSLSKIEALKDSLKGLNLRSYPAENVTLFVQDATKLVREIKVNYMSNYSIPDLTTAVLSGLTVASDPLLLAQVRNLRIQSDVNGFCLPSGRGTLSLPVPDALEALKMIDELYRVLVNQSDYGPARKPVHKANLAGVGEDSKLEQHRDSGGGTVSPPITCAAVLLAPIPRNEMESPMSTMALTRLPASRLARWPKRRRKPCLKGNISLMMPDTQSRLMERW